MIKWKEKWCFGRRMNNWNIQENGYESQPQSLSKSLPGKLFTFSSPDIALLFLLSCALFAFTWLIKYCWNSEKNTILSSIYLNLNLILHSYFFLNLQIGFIQIISYSMRAEDPGMGTTMAEFSILTHCRAWWFCNTWKCAFWYENLVDQVYAHPCIFAFDWFEFLTRHVQTIHLLPLVFSPI